MKKLAIFAAAFVLTLGLAQCKKEQPNAQNIEGETVHITLNVNNNGSRADVNTSTGHITFNDNDKLYVGYNNACVGTLDYSTSANKFSGDITISQSGSQRLHFYYLGGSLTPTVSGSEYTVDISNQTSNYPVISYGTSTQNYSASLNSYTTTLLNQCALVEFTTNEIPTTTAVSISGMKNKVTVDFNGNTLTPSEERGTIKLHAESPTSRWAILLPQQNITGVTANAEGYDEASVSFTVSEIKENDYLTESASFTLTATAPSVPTGALNGLFSVSATKQVRFSQGNLQYIGSAATPYWKFANHQWDYLGKEQGVGIATADYDLFGWGTSGYNHGATCYQPWSYENNSSKYYAYGGEYKNLFDESGKADWGYNAISNGGGEEHKWRTLSRPEWVYILDERTTSTGIRYAKAKVNDVNGVILLPDDWSSDTYSLSNTNSSGASFSSNTILASQWNTLEQAGAVFLPAAGKRIGTDFHDVGIKGYYWSASHENTYNAKCMYFDGSNLLSYDKYNKHNGQSVRLVRPVEN